MQSHLIKFIEYLRFEKRFSEHTIIAYEADLAQFTAYLEKSCPVDITEVNHTIIRSWMVEMMEHKITPRTINRKLSSLKTFYKFLLRQQVITVNPMLKVQSPKTSKRLPVFVQKPDMDNLLNNIVFPDDLEGLRDKLILEIFYSTGMRLTELINLKNHNVNTYDLSIKVLGKRNKERSIPFGFNLKDSIEKFNSTKHFTAANDFFFCNEKGEKYYPKKIYTIVNNYLSQVTSINKKSPHILRHTFATHMLNNGADINAIKELLGHANLSATQVYTHNTIDKLKKIYTLAHPKA